ncbi:MAG: nucleotide sugar dehydrogenase [Candidatus Woykebacteria bacterium]
MELSKFELKTVGGVFSSELEEKISSGKVRVGIVGVGYVGQALTASLVESGIRTFGYDLDESKYSRIEHKLFIGSKFIEELETCEVICICVPTPLDENKKPDLRFLQQAAQALSKFHTKNQLIIIESTVAPGTTRNFVLPLLTLHGRRHEEDFFLAFSPERVDPGNAKFHLKNTPKIVGGLGKTAPQLTAAFYSKFVDEVVVTSSPEVAELTKMLENSFRLVNVSFINEMKHYADAAGIDIWEAINAAATKPFGFLPHYPGPGVGGHCIPVDPVYLLEEAASKNIDLPILKSAVLVNDLQPKKIVAAAKGLTNGRSDAKNKKMLLLGIAYKPDTADTRESPALKIMVEAEKEGFEVNYFDPYVPKYNGFTSSILTRELVLEQDVIVIATHHQNIPYELFADVDVPIIDTRNVLRQFKKDKVSFGEERLS